MRNAAAESDPVYGTACPDVCRAPTSAVDQSILIYMAATHVDTCC